MKCPECDNELNALWAVGYVGKDKIKVKHYVCNNRDCKAHRKLWCKSLETGEAVDPPLIAEQLDKLEKY